MVTRPPRQQDQLKTHASMVYGLGNEGADLLSRINGTERGKTNWQRRNREIGGTQIEHTLMVGRCRITLTLALASLQGANLRHWEPEGDSLNAKVVVDGEPLPIRPDAFFVLELSGQKRPFRNYSLEADRSTMTHKRFLAKLRAYWHGRRFYADLLGITNFRVVTICRSQERADNLRTLAAEADPRGNGSEMFMFCSEESFSLQDFKILDPIWSCGRGDCAQLHTLFQ
jgi:hypothetical protein